MKVLIPSVFLLTEILNRNNVLAFTAKPPPATVNPSQRLLFRSTGRDNSIVPRYMSDSFAHGLDEEFVAFPDRDYDGPGVVQTCMDALMKNSEPYGNAGLEVCFNFSSDRCRAAQGGSLEKFIEFADNPTFGSMVDAKSWEIMSTGPIIAGTNTRGAMQTQLVDVTPGNGRKRRFLWTLQQERRPPRQGCWLVHECIVVENAYSQTT